MKACIISVRDIPIPCELQSLNLYQIKNGSLEDKAAKAFRFFDSILFIGSCAIAIKILFRHLSDKMSDPSILVSDEKFFNTVLLCGSHMAGGQRVGEKISSALKNNFVFSTATDINGLTGIDLFCRDNCMTMEKKEILSINTELLKGKQIELSKDFSDFFLPKQYILSETPKIQLNSYSSESVSLYTKDFSVGVGFHKNTCALELIREFQTSVPGWIRQHTGKLATIEKKYNTLVFHEFARACNIPFTVCCETHSLDMAVRELGLKENPVVRKNTGVGAVSEPCAFIASGKGKKILEIKRKNCKFVVYQNTNIKPNNDPYNFEKVPEVFHEL